MPNRVSRYETLNGLSVQFPGKLHLSVLYIYPSQQSARAKMFEIGGLCPDHTVRVVSH
jgi:hypothetical protein